MVDLDHQQYLGNTVAEIAVEKAGIIKPGGLVVTGETRTPALDVIRHTCAHSAFRTVLTGII